MIQKMSEGKQTVHILNKKSDGCIMDRNIVEEASDLIGFWKNVKKIDNYHLLNT